MTVADLSHFTTPHSEFPKCMRKRTQSMAQGIRRRNAQFGTCIFKCPNAWASTVLAGRRPERPLIVGPAAEQAMSRASLPHRAPHFFADGGPTPRAGGVDQISVRSPRADARGNAKTKGQGRSLAGVTCADVSERHVEDAVSREVHHLSDADLSQHVDLAARALHRTPEARKARGRDDDDASTRSRCRS